VDNHKPLLQKEDQSKEEKGSQSDSTCLSSNQEASVKEDRLWVCGCSID